MLTVEQSSQSHSEMVAQVERLGINKQHVHKCFHDMPQGPSSMGRGFNYDILANPAYCHRFDYVPTWQQGRLSFIAAPNYDKDFNREAAKGEAKKTEELYKHETPEEVLMTRCQSDYVRWVLELAYRTKEDALRIDTTTKGLALEITRKK